MVFKEEDGLLNSEIWLMYIDFGGVIWIGQSEGFSCFDGIKFENIVILKFEVKVLNMVYFVNWIIDIVED